MSEITGREPKHWHDANGKHRMPDPRAYAAPVPVEGTNEMSAGASKRDVCTGDADLSAYWDHLDEHDKDTPTPRAGDSDAVRALFAKIEAGEQEIATARELITVLRQAGH